ncbi:hypothetical protein D9613_010783 [Agrocybe pediades]|uniref:Uncharacterized protein n=1 Tax=Agrocybe pediades TaxID=84607 RepID=A0A8H4QMJ7_9AGAR|nr:hypothetical protein D9613_010783 [Agrocybe pediades]
MAAIFAVHMRHTMTLQAIHPEQAFIAAILTSAIDLLSLERNSEILDAEQTTPSQHALSFEHDA